MLGRVGWLLAVVFVLGCGDDAASPDGGGPMCMTNADCDDGVFCSGVERCMPTAPGADARGCVALGDPCLGGQTCDEGAGRCATDCAVTQDADGDGVDAIECGGTDCNDSDAESYPGNAEICDAEGRDEDCDPTTLGGDDADDDGYIDIGCCNGDVCGQDCDDSEPSIRPTQTDSTCDGVDNDCDGEADEDATPLVYYVDRDGDGYGDESRGSMEICAPEVEGYARLSGDCDDDNEFIYPGAPEVCDRIVNDCGTTPGSPRPEEDSDNDGFAAPDADCEGGPLPKTDCNDGRFGVNPDAAERECNGIDDDCDGMLAVREDMDQDGAPSQDCCEGDGGRFCDVETIDCDDSDAAVYVGAPNICDGQQNQCGPDGSGPIGPNDDLDGDGEAATDDACMDGPLPKTDCDDSNPLVGASIPEYCGDVTDNDCDTMVDEGCPTGFTVELPGTAAMTVGTTAAGSAFDLECAAGVVRLVDVGPGGSGPLDALRGRCFALQPRPVTRGVPVLQLEVDMPLGATTTLGTNPEEVLGCSNDEEAMVGEFDMFITSLDVRPNGIDGIEGLQSRCASVSARVEDGVIVDWIVNDRGGDRGDSWGRPADMPSDCPAGTLPVGFTGSGEPNISELGLICADIVPTFD